MRIAAFVLVIAIATIGYAESDIDWSKVVHRDITPKNILNLWKTPKPRIVGGEEVVPNSIPYQAGIIITTPGGTFFCGGSLISTRFVLTAAHCVESATNIQVILGAHRVQTLEDTQLRILTTSFVIHPAWDSNNLVNDIALVELPEPVPLSINIQLVVLPGYSEMGQSFSGQTSRISGWGITADGSPSLSEVLMAVSVEVITNFICNLTYLGIIQSTHLCTSGSDGRGSCSGDSGGPVVIGNKQVGIVSFGLSLGCQLGWPSGHTRVTSFLNWIGANSDAVIGP